MVAETYCYHKRVGEEGMRSDFPLSAITRRLAFLLGMAIVVRGIDGSDEECTSNQDCIYLANQNARYGDWFCWKDHTCNPYPQLVMVYTSKEPPGKNGENGNGKKSPYPVFTNGQEMCVTVMIDPSIVYTDRLWETLPTTINRTQRLDTLKELPLKLDIKTLRMCTSTVEKNLEEDDDTQDENGQVAYVRNTHVRHFDVSEPESTGCNSIEGGNVVVETLYDRNKALKGTVADEGRGKEVATLGHSDNALSSTVCFHTKVLGPSHLPTYVEARVGITRIGGKKKATVENARILKSLGLSSPSSRVGVTVTSSDSMAATTRWRERMLADVDKRQVSDHYNTMLGQNRERDLTPQEMEDADCDGNSDYSLDHDFGLGPEEHQRYNDYCLSLKQRHSGYYYYGDDDSYYYYYHPHVVCDHDLEFRGTAGVCEQEGSLKGETGLHVFILFINNAVGIAFIIAFCFDYRSGVLFL
jgi:hypothetical protein